MTVKVTKKKLEESLETYANLVEVYPENEAYLQRYADMLQALGREATATITLQHLHDVIAKRSESEAAAFAKKYPQIGRISLDEVFDAQDNHSITGKIIFELLGKLWLKLHQKKLKEGQVVCKAEQLSDSLILVLQGSVEVYAVDKNNTRILLERVGMHDVLGEQTFLNPNNMGLDAFVSSESATIVHVPRKKLLHMIENNQHLASMLTQRALFRSNIHIVATHPIFKTLPLKLCKYLARNLEQQSFAAKQMIYTLDTPMNGLHIILSGKACYIAKNKDGKKLALPPLPPRSLVGDFMLKGDKALQTTELFAASAVKAAHIPHQFLLNINSAFPPLRERLLQYADAQQQHIAQALSKLKHA